MDLARIPSQSLARHHPGPAVWTDLPGRRARTVPDAMATPDELNHCIRAVAAHGDRDAFVSLFKHFAPRVNGYLVRCGCPSGTAEELTQETMVLLWRNAATFDPARAALTTWLFTIARNVRIDHHRRRQLAADSHSDGEPWDGDLHAADSALPPDESVLAGQRERHVHRALAELPPDQAHLLRLSFFEEHPHARIAQELDLPLGTVKSRIRRAVAKLRRHLDGMES